MVFGNLTEREAKILKILVDHYIATAEPVASGSIAKNYNLNLSSATIRNTIKILEDMELVQKPHTSAGRIPTISGYRLYVNYLLHPEELSEDEKTILSKYIIKEFNGIDQILEQTSRILGLVSNQLGITIAPQFESGIITKLELIPVASGKVLVVLALKSGLARTLLLEVETSLKDIAVIETSIILNEKLCGLTIGELKRTIKERLAESTMGDPRLVKMFIDSSDRLLNFHQEKNIHFGSARHVLNQPEFSNPQKIKEFIELIEQSERVEEIISKAGQGDGITVTVGVDSTEQSEKIGYAAELSFLSSSYSIGKLKGTLGIIGPTRMPYSKLVGIIDYTAKRLSQILSE